MARNRNVKNMFTKVLVDVGVNEIDIAYALSVAPRTVSNWIAEPRTISITNLEKLAEFTGVEVTYLLEVILGYWDEGLEYDNEFCTD